MRGGWENWWLMDQRRPRVGSNVESRGFKETTDADRGRVDDVRRGPWRWKGEEARKNICFWFPKNSKFPF